METTGSVALVEVAARATHLDVACTRCSRRGRYRLARLVEQFGGDYAMTDLGAELANCPSRARPRTANAATCTSLSSGDLGRRRLVGDVPTCLALRVGLLQRKRSPRAHPGVSIARRVSAAAGFSFAKLPVRLSRSGVSPSRPLRRASFCVRRAGSAVLSRLAPVAPASATSIA